MKKKPKNTKVQSKNRSKRGKVHAHIKKYVSPHIEKTRAWIIARSLLQKLMLVIVALVILIVGTMYGIAQWYIAQNSGKPLKVGVTFIPSYAQSLGVDPQQTMRAMIDELGVRQFRLVSYWDVGEKTKGKYDFSQLDWQFKYAEESHSKVSLAIGLRQPRWPECHMPDWAAKLPKDQWAPLLKDYMKAVIEHYKNSPALESYQLENEYFLKVFGQCPDFSRDRLVDEYNYVKQLDPNHKVIISRSNNALGLPVGQPTPDEFGVSIYKRVWDKTITKRYFEYPFPAWFYGFLAGAGKILTGKDMVIHELQAEPWPPTSIQSASLEEQDKSMDAQRLKDRFEYGRATGMREMYLWGAEWWYWRKIKYNDSSVWDAAKDEIARLTNAPNNNCKNFYNDSLQPPCN